MQKKYLHKIQLYIDMFWKPFSDTLKPLLWAVFIVIFRFHPLWRVIEMKLVCRDDEQLRRGRACKSWSNWRKTPTPMTSSVSLMAARSSPKRLSDTRVLCPHLLPVSPLMLEWSWKHEHRDPEGGKLARRGQVSFIGQEGGMVQWQAEGEEGVRDCRVGGTTPSRGYSGHFAHEHICSDASACPSIPKQCQPD